MKRILNPLWLVGILIAALVVAHGYLSLVSANSLLEWFHFDDAFYYFKTAQNIVAGRGVTFDGTGPTNGFHPLWLLLLLPIYAVAQGDLILPLRLIVGLVALLLVGTVAVFYREGRRHFGDLGPLVVLALWLLVPSRYLVVVAGGIESALSVFTLVLFWAALAYVRRTERETDPRAVAWVGLAAALTMLARLDNALLVAVAGLVFLARWWRAKVPWAQQVKLALAYGLPGFIGVGAFLVWSRLYVGTWTPISSQVKAWWGSLHGTPYGRALRYQAPAFVAAFWGEPLHRWPQIWEQYRPLWRRRIQPLLPLLAGGALGLAGMYWAARRQWPLWRRFQRAALDVFFLGAAFHFVYLKFLSGLSPLRDWYWTSEQVLGALVVAWALGEGIRWLSQKWSGTRVLAGALTALLVVGLALQFVQVIVKGFPLHNDRLHLYLHQARWVEERTEPGSVVGATGAGSLGYFIQGRTLLALDGLIGTPAYLRAWKEGRALEYLQAHHLEYVMGGFWVTKMEPYRQVFADRLQPIDRYDYGGYKAILFRFLP